MSAKLLLITLVLSVTPVVGQTATEIEEVYGKPSLAYSVTQHIWMTPDFAANGQVCRMRFYPRRVGRDAAYLGGKLDSAELKWILNHIIPPSSTRRSLRFDGCVESVLAFDKAPVDHIKKRAHHVTNQILEGGTEQVAGLRTRRSLETSNTNQRTRVEPNVADACVATGRRSGKAHS